MTRTRLLVIGLCSVAAIAVGYLRDPAWAGQVTSGMRAWEEESDFRAAIEADPEIRAILSPE